ncbi:MAG: hypothetical protein ACK4MS_03190 [Paracoccaceae bacterium]
MITVSIAKFFIDLVGEKAVQGGEPAGPVLNSPKRATLRSRAFSLLPVGLQTRILVRRDTHLQTLAVQRLAELSPHLLADIGVVKCELATVDGRDPNKRNTALVGLVGEVSLSNAGSFSMAGAAQNH